MTDYRLYFLDETGHIREALELDCRDDDEAITLAEARREGGPIELWQRSRVVRRFPAD